MSMETWKKEFYPITAREVSVDDAAAHSLKKWIGLRKENLDKHEVVMAAIRKPMLQDKNGESHLFIDDSTCALCMHHLHKYTNRRACVTCPITLATGLPCDREAHSPWSIWQFNRDPEPMIVVLKAAIDYEQHHNDVVVKE